MIECIAVYGTIHSALWYKTWRSMVLRRNFLTPMLNLGIVNLGIVNLGITLVLLTLELPW
jgi:hypothetical protein